MRTLSLVGSAAVARTGLVVGVMALAALVAAPADARTYKVDEFDKKLSARGALAKRYARNPNPGGEEEQAFRAYVEQYFLPAMTRSDSEALENLGKSRAELFKSFLWGSDSRTQQYVTSEAMKFAERVLKGRYHPSVRYNALLILGQLDDKYSGGEDPPTPSAAANEWLYKIAARASADPRRPRYELAGALVGLERQTRYFSSLPKANQQNTAKTLGKLLVGKELPGNYAPEVKDWIYLKAATAMANIGVAGSKGMFFLAVARRAADESLTLETRAAIAAQLARIDAKPGAFKAAAAVKVVRELAAEIGQKESEIADKLEGTFVRRGGARIVANEREKTFRRFKQKDRRDWTLVREGLLAELTDLRKGVRAVGKLADVDDKIAMASIDEAIGDAIKTVGDESTAELTVTAAIKQMGDAIDAAATAEETPGLADASR